ncbi:MAG TPA: Zn-ribbon domain-containing OB-fold protein [Candidatus Binataceae bacterium]|nr:Zn-ribbon domain-containing OB-fold protein [Candidatus Binataceae bacterium]
MDKRLPVLQGYTGEFYEWCGKHELRFQRCQKCGVWRHPPRPMCSSCHSLQWEWAPVKGHGAVYCWTVIHQPLDPVFADDVPYAAVIVELEEGPRLATWVTGVPPDQLRVGMTVELWFDQISNEVTLPKFKPVS